MFAASEGKLSFEIKDLNVIGFIITFTSWSFGKEWIYSFVQQQTNFL